MTKWIVGVFLVICIGIALYFIFRPKDDCDYAGHAQKAGVDFGATIQHVTAVKGNLGLSDEDITVLDQFRQDYADKYRNICLDWKRKAIGNDEYNCRRENMDKVLDQFRLLNTVQNAKDKSQAEQALNAIKQFASSGISANCAPHARLIVNPNELELPDEGTSVWTQITNLGNRDAHYSFDQLPQSFLPTPASGLIGSGQAVSVVFVRTKYPMSEKEVNFLLRDDSSEQISLRIKVSRLKAEVYNTFGAELARLSHGNPTVEDALTLVKKTWPNSKSEAADYVVAANLLDSAGSPAAANKAVTASLMKDKSLATNPTAQFTLAILRAKTGDKLGSELALEQWIQATSGTSANQGNVRYFSGLASLKFGNWSSAKEDLCSPETKNWAKDHAEGLEFGAKELEIPGVNEAVNSISCDTRILRIALDRTSPNDPEYQHIYSVLNDQPQPHRPKAEQF